MSGFACCGSRTSVVVPGVTTTKVTDGNAVLFALENLVSDETSPNGFNLARKAARVGFFSRPPSGPHHSKLFGYVVLFSFWLTLFELFSC